MRGALGFVLALLRVIWCVLAVICGFSRCVVELGFLGFLMLFCVYVGVFGVVYWV